MNKASLFLILLLSCLACHTLGQEAVTETVSISEGVTEEVETSNQAQQILITVSGNGAVKTQPDIIQLTLGLYFKNDSVAQVQQQAQNASANLITFFESQGVNSTDIQTSFFNLSPYFVYYGGEEGGGTKIPRGYTITDTLIVIIRNLSSFNNILAGAYSIGINSVQDIEFLVNDIETVRTNARKLAIDNARNIAQTLVNGSGAQLGGVLSIDDQTQDYPPSAPTVLYNAVNTSSGPSVAQGVIEIDATVQVTYFIDNSSFNNGGGDNGEEGEENEGGNEGLTELEEVGNPSGEDL